MGVFDRLLKKPRNRVTPDQMGVVLAYGAFHSADSLFHRLVGADPTLPDDFRVRTELLVFSLLPFVMIAKSMFADHHSEIRASMLSSVPNMLEPMFQQPDDAGIDWEDVPNWVEQRWSEYVSAMGPEITSDSWTRVSNLAAKIICGTDHADLHIGALLGTDFVTSMNQMPKSFGKYTIV